MPAKIPGFYYDVEKNKYFAIRKNHNVPAGSKYTTSDVARRNEIKREVLRKELKARQEFGSRPIPPRTRSKILQSQLGRDLARSTGEIKNATSKDDIIQTHLNHFQRRQPHDLNPDGNPDGSPATILRVDDSPHSDLDDTPVCETTDWEMDSFVWDSCRNSLYFTARANCCCTDFLTQLDWMLSMNSEDPFRVHEERTLFTHKGPFVCGVAGSLVNRGSTETNNARTSIISLTPRGALLSTLMAADYGAPQYRLFFDGGRRHEDPDVIDLLGPDGYYFEGAEMAQSTLWCAAPNPFGSDNIMTHPERTAFGTDEGVVLEDRLAGSIEPCDERIVIKTYSDVLSLEWMSPNTLAAGLRNSGILLIDDRSGTSVVRLRHTTSVTQLARVDNTGMKLVACGFPSSMAMYDLRMVKEVVHSNAQGFMNERKPEALQNLTPQKFKVSEPLFSFDYQNKKEMYLGFDICRPWGLLAAAQDDGGIRIYSLRTGRTLKELSIMNPLQTLAQQTPVRCVKFVDDYESGMRILASQGTGIYQFGIHDHDDME